MAEPVENEDIEVVSGHSSDDTVTCSHNEPDDHDEPTDPDRSTSSETPELRNLLDSIKKKAIT